MHPQTEPSLNAWLEQHRVDISSLRSNAVVGVGHAKREVESIVQRLQLGPYLDRIGAEMPRGILFHGPAGTGKTLTARYLAHLVGEATPFYEVSGDELTPERVRDLFRRLDGERAVLYLDEIDHIGRPKGDWRHDPESRQTLIALLAAIDGLRSGAGILVVASSTDAPGELDRALLRGGRLGIWVGFSIPEHAERVALFEHFAATREFDGEVDWEEAARLTSDASPADLRQLLDEAVGIALGNGQPLPGNDAVLEAARRRGVVRPDLPVDEHMRRRYAIHEAGHVGIAVAVFGARRVVEVSIHGYGGQMSLDDQPPRDTTHALDLEMLVAFGGTVAEELVLGSASEGGAHDVFNATNILLRQLSFGVLADFPPVSLAMLGDFVSEEMRQQVSRLVADRLDLARADVRRSLYGQADALQCFAADLEAAETLVGDRLQRALGSATCSPTAKARDCAGIGARAPDDPPDVPITLGRVLRGARRAKGLSQRELACRLGVSQPLVSLWESDARHPEFALLIESCALLGLRPDTALRLAPSSRRERWRRRTPNVGAALREARLSTRLPLVELALSARIAPRRLREIEAGRAPEMDEARRLCQSAALRHASNIVWRLA